MRALPIAVVTLLAAALPAGCNASSSDEPVLSPSAAAADQIARGGVVFGASCARCHGDAGQGSRKAPALVGDGALPLHPREASERASAFRTALDVALFATQNMPPEAEKRAKLAESDYWAVLAFALSANGVELARPVGPDNASSIVLHP